MLGVKPVDISRAEEEISERKKLMIFQDTGSSRKLDINTDVHDEDYQPIAKLKKNENGDFLADCQNILNI
jgi:hypothetical protein